MAKKPLLFSWKTIIGGYWISGCIFSSILHIKQSKNYFSKPEKRKKRCNLCHKQHLVDFQINYIFLWTFYTVKTHYVFYHTIQMENLWSEKEKKSNHCLQCIQILRLSSGKTVILEQIWNKPKLQNNGM